MSEQPSMRITCPSCGSKITIKNDSLLGKKIDCPKCKYKFTAERDGAAAGAKGKKKLVETPAPAPKKKINSTMIQGGALAIVALVVLVGSYFMFFGDDEPKPNPVKPKANPSVTNTLPEQPVEKKEPPKIVRKEPPPREISNLLPEETQWILTGVGKPLMATAPATVLFDPTGDQGKFFRKHSGLDPAEIEQFIIAGGLDAAWMFTVVRTSKDLVLESLKQSLGLEAPKLVKSRTGYTVKQPNELFELIAQMGAGEFKSRGIRWPASGPGRTYGAVLLDSRTLVLADSVQLDRFLAGDAKRREQTRYVPPAPLEKEKPKEGETPAKQPDPLPTDGIYSSNPTYLSIEPALKSLINQLDPEHKAPLMFVAKGNDLTGVFGGMLDPLRTRKTENPLPALLAPKLTHIGAMLTSLTIDRLAFEVRFECADSNDAATWATLYKAIAGPYLASELSEATGVKVIAIDAPVPVEAPKGKEEAPSNSTVAFGQADKAITLNVSVEWRSQYNAGLGSNMRGYVDGLKGKAMLLAGKPYWQSFTALPEKIEASRSLPQAALPRPTDETRLSLPYPPMQRLSWLTEMLPYLGHDATVRTIQKERAWNDPDNLRAGSAWIPEFLNPTFPEATWRTRAGGRELGATHFVGIAGVGLDAAEYPDTPSYSKKLGIFGYDRQATLADVEAGDGRANTIFAVQVPPTVSRPWIRGGGATVQGVSVSGSVKPFVTMMSAGRNGTYALMADGSVRFVAADISDEVFKAMATYKGGEKLDTLDGVAPKELLDPTLRQNKK